MEKLHKTTNFIYYGQDIFRIVAACLLRSAVALVIAVRLCDRFSFIIKFCCV